MATPLLNHLLFVRVSVLVDVAHIYLGTVKIERCEPQEGPMFQTIADESAVFVIRWRQIGVHLSVSHIDGYAALADQAAIFYVVRRIVDDTAVLVTPERRVNAFARKHRTKLLSQNSTNIRAPFVRAEVLMMSQHDSLLCVCIELLFDPLGLGTFRPLSSQAVSRPRICQCLL